MYAHLAPVLHEYWPCICSARDEVAACNIPQYYRKAHAKSTNRFVSMLGVRIELTTSGLPTKVVILAYETCALTN